MKGRKDGCKDGGMDGRMEGWTDGRKDGRSHGRKDGRTDGRKDGSMKGWIKGWIDQTGTYSGCIKSLESEVTYVLLRLMEKICFFLFLSPNFGLNQHVHRRLKTVKHVIFRSKDLMVLGKVIR